MTHTDFDIDTDYLQKQLLQLLAIPSPAGLTAASLDYLSQALQALGISQQSRTRRGALLAEIPGQEPVLRRALSAHVDTLGAMVRECKANGRLGILPIGSWSSRTAEGCRVRIHTASGTVYRGTIMPLKASGHAFAKEVDNQPVTWDQVEIRVDADSHSSSDLAALGLQVGDIVSVDPQSEILANGYIVSRFLDDLGGVACLLTAVKALRDQGLQPACSSALFFSHYEELGHGASLRLPESIEELVSVDIAIVAEGQNSAEDKVSVVYMDNSGPYDPQLTRQLESLARDQQLPVSRDVFRYYFSDCAAAIQAGNDVRHALIGFGTDASHSFERTHLNGLEATVRLICAYLCAPLDSAAQA